MNLKNTAATGSTYHDDKHSACAFKISDVISMEKTIYCTKVANNANIDS